MLSETPTSNDMITVCTNLCGSRLDCSYSAKSSARRVFLYYSINGHIVDPWAGSRRLSKRASVLFARHVQFTIVSRLAHSKGQILA